MISKVLGKKQIAQLEFIDYVVGISIGSIAAEMATDVSDNPFYYYLIGMTIFFLFDMFASYIGRKGKFFKTFFKGRPIVIIYDGEIIYENLIKSKLDINDLLVLARDKNFFDLSDIAFAIFETSGKLSIMPKSNQKPPVLEDMQIKVEPASLPNYLVTDGVISKSGLNEIGKDKKWLFGKLKIEPKQIKDILVASYDDKNDKINVTFKNQ